MLEYDRLTIRVEPTNGHYRVFAEGQAGQAHGEFDVPFEPRDVENFVLRMSRGRRTTRRIETSDAAQAKDFGRRLFDALFRGDVRDVYTACLADARRAEHGLRVTLALTKAPKLMDLPWEYLYDEPDFLAASMWTPVVRYLDVAKPAAPLVVPPPLRILGMVSRPSDVPELDVEGERRRLEEALRPLLRAGRMEVHWTQAATLDALLRKLRAGSFHVFHFVGHGAYDETREDGLLLLEGEDGRSQEVTGEALGRILNDQHPMRLAVLNACEGARASQTDPFAGVAASLVQRGLPAVVAMQFEITDKAAVTFAEYFYAAVALGYPVDAAVAHARQGIFASNNDVEWGTPVLFLRSADGRIFDLDWEDARSEHASLAASLEARPAEVTEGEEVTWTLYVQNTGRPSLFDATPHGEDGRPLCKPADLVSGENVVFTWSAAAEVDPVSVVNVVARTGDGTEVLAHAETRLQVRPLLKPAPEPEVKAEPEAQAEVEVEVEVAPSPIPKPKPEPTPEPLLAPEPRRWTARRSAGGLAVAAVALIALIVLLSGGDDGRGGGSSSGSSEAKPIPLPGAPNGIAYVKDGSRVWVSTRAGMVGITSDDRVLKRAQAATKGGSTFTADEASLWVGIPADSTVVQLDAQTGRRREPSLHTATPRALALSPGAVWVSAHSSGSEWVERFDANSGGSELRIDVPEKVVRISVRGDTLWALVQDPGAGPDHIDLYGVDKGEPRDSVPVGAGARAMAYGKDDDAFWVVNADAGTLTRVDAETRATSTFKVGGSPANLRVGLEGVWVTNPGSGAVQRLDPESRKVTDYRAGPRPYSLVLTDDGVWVADAEENNVRFLEP